MWAASKAKNPEDSRRLTEAVRWDTYKIYQLKRSSFPGGYCSSSIWETQPKTLGNKEG